MLHHHLKEEGFNLLVVSAHDWLSPSRAWKDLVEQSCLARGNREGDGAEGTGIGR